MTKNKRLSLVMRIHRHKSRKYSWNKLCQRYGLSASYVRYHYDRNFRERVVKNSIKWIRENKDKAKLIYKRYHLKKLSTIAKKSQ